ncbi:MAG: lysylphosphatidylglycerol synthase transmembrane domain-containing protein [Phaeodactylibacter sp.]|uniref:lysylphosphatidylglycerol synthase transmembrane domain-containing protein n=1 Tax=Phaeodactylibacter sp. TaxID=1940289 RepID=UPI0032EB07E8
MRLTRGLRYWLDATFKVLLVAALLYLLYREIGGQERLADLWEQLRYRLGERSKWWLLPAVLLMPVNWWLESWKWQRLLKPFWSIAPWQAFKAVASGITLSLFTPNRVGDYGGRVLAVPAQHNWHAVIATMAGNVAQTLALFTGGLIGALYYLEVQGGLPRLLLSSFWWVLFVGIGVAYLFYFNFHWLALILRTFPMPRKWLKPVLMLRRFNRAQLGEALLLAFSRYSVYCMQYYLMIRFFGIDAPLDGALSGIATIFLFQATVPLPPVAALLARGEAALLIWAPFSSNELSILGATFGLFILNLALPALLGVIFIVKINVLKSLGYDKNTPENQRAGATGTIPDNHTKPSTD